VAVKRMGMLGASVKKMETLTVKETVTLINGDRIWHALCIKCMKQ